MSQSQEQPQQGSISPQSLPQLSASPSASPSSVPPPALPSLGPSPPRMPLFDALPSLSITPSGTYTPQPIPSLLGHNRRQHSTKLCLVKKSLKTLIDNAYLLHKGNKIVLFLFDHECTCHEFTMSDEGYAAALQFVQEIRHRGTTNIIKVCHDMRTYVDGLVASGIAPEHIMKTFLTDGHHYDREGSTTIDMLIAPPPIVVGDSEEASAKEAITRKAHADCEFFRSFFDHVGGIGNTVSKKTLGHFEGGRPGVYDHVETEDDVVNVFQGKYFNLLTAYSQDGEVKIWFRNDGSDIPLDEAKTTFHTEEEFQEHIAIVSAMDDSKEMAIEHSYGSYVIKPTVVKEEVRQAAHPKTFCLAVDISGSMADYVQMQTQTQAQAQAQTSLASIAEDVASPAAAPKLYGCHTFYVNKFTPDTVLSGKVGEVLFATVKATNISTKETTVCRLPVLVGMETKESMELYSIVFDLYKAVKMPLKKDQIMTLYKDHLFVPELLKNASLNLRTMGEIVWTAMKKRYISTLSYGEQVADNFMNRPPVGLPMLTLIASSSNAATATSSGGVYEQSMASSTSTYATTATGVVIDINDDTKCQFCFENNKSMMLLPCRHIGTCHECFVKHIIASANTKCAFCRQIVTGRVDLDLSKGTICRTNGCHQQYQYVCEKGHGLYCKGCISTHMTGSAEERHVICPDCPEPSKRVRLYIM
jgi:hypothetical protein